MVRHHGQEQILRVSEVRVAVNDGVNDLLVLRAESRCSLISHSSFARCVSLRLSAVMYSLRASLALIAGPVCRARSVICLSLGF